MLLGICCIGAVLTAFLTCLGTDAFATLQWLWVLPVSLLGGFLGLLVLACLFLLAVTAPLDPEKEYEQDSPFYRFLANLFVGAAIPLLRVKIKTRGLEKTPKEGRFLLVCNHLHEVDPAILLHFFKKSQLAFISKRENKTLPVIGKLMPRLLCQLINRENDREALKTILKCIRLLKEDKVSVAVFPEGYIHDDRKFHHLRPGVFKIAQKANVPIVVCTLRDTQYIIRNFLHGKASPVQLHLLEVIPAEALQDKTTVQIAEYVHGIMAADLGPEYVPEDEEST